ncbi:hypothetical protein Tco_0984610 [Tanacetum coccineum]
MDDPNITMEEYIRLEEEKAHRRDKVYNWETATYVNVPSFPSSEPTVSYFDEFDYFKEFKNEFPAIAYNDALTSKLDFSPDPTVSPKHIDEFNLKNDTSLSECDGEDQNVIYFHDLFPFNVIYLDDLKSNKDNENNKIDIK